ncbi:MAG: phosphoglucosamine mutase, partial [Frankiaceae bacterium]|nr:phosphoglucosamine mutase [Frankiaceae bacterium]
MGRLFGTDGVRGLANVTLTPELALGIARAAVAVLAPRHPAPGDSAAGASGPETRPLAVVGRDPRASGEMLEAAVVAGLTSAGADVLRVGVLPTPAIARLSADYGADLGVMLSASHNPMPDNGIKLFAAGGAKLSDDVENRIEAMLLRAMDDERPFGAQVGRVRDAPDAAARYTDFLLAGLDHRLDGLRVVVDCAHGAAAAVAPEVYRRAGAEVIAIAASPDGLNINDGVGSTHLGGLIAAVREHGADVGIAHDGDADRCLAVDAEGAVVDGDQILALCALALRDRGALRGDAVVATVMSNIGFHQAMAAAGIEVVTTAVGDRYVLEALAGRGLSLGGEQSGHVVFADRCPTGDGLLTALTVLSAVAESGRPLAELAAVVRRAPQVLINVAVADKDRVLRSPAVADAMSDAERELGAGGRVLLRPSGTEALFRVMVEAPTQAR